MPSPSASFDLDSSSLARGLDLAAPSFSPLGSHAVADASVLAPLRATMLSSLANSRRPHKATGTRY